MKKILIVDDELPYLYALNDILKINNYNVIQEINSDKVINTIEKEKPDCIVIDATLEGISGFDICRKLKEIPEFALIPVILTIPQNENWDLYDAVTSKGDDCIQKPISKNELIDKIENQFLNLNIENQHELLKKQIISLTDNIKNPLLIFTTNGTIVSANNEFIKFFNIETSIINENIDVLFPEIKTEIQNLIDGEENHVDSKLGKMSLFLIEDEYVLIIEKQKEEKKTGEVIINSDILLKLYSSMDMSELINNFKSILSDIIQTDYIHIASIIDDEIIMSSLERPTETAMSININETKIQRIVSEKSCFIGNIKDKPDTDLLFFKQNGLKSAMLKPLYVADKVFVICFLSNEENAFYELDKNFNILFQEFILLYQYHLNFIKTISPTKEIVSGENHSKYLLESILKYTSEPLIIFKDGEIKYLSNKIKEIFKEDDFEESFKKMLLNEKEASEFFSHINKSNNEFKVKITLKSGEKYNVSFNTIDKGYIICFFKKDIEKEKFLIDYQNKLDEIIDTNKDINPCLREFRALIKDYFNVDEIAFLLYNDKTEVLTLHSIDGKYEGYKIGMSLDISGSIFEKVRDDKEGFYNNNLNTLSICKNEQIVKDFGYLSYIAIPLIARNRILGAIELFSKEKESFNEQHMELFTITAKKIADKIIEAVIIGRLKETEEKYKAIKLLSNEIILIVNSSGKIIEVSDVILRILGYSSDDIKRMNIKELLGPGIEWKTVLEKSGRYDFENRKGGVKSMDVSSKCLSSGLYLLLIKEVFHRE